MTDVVRVQVCKGAGDAVRHARNPGCPELEPRRPAAAQQDLQKGSHQDNQAWHATSQFLLVEDEVLHQGLGTCNTRSQTCRLGFCARGSPSTRSSTSACGSSMIATTLHALHAQAALNVIIHANVCTASAWSTLGPMTHKPSWRNAAARDIAGTQP